MSLTEQEKWVKAVKAHFDASSKYSGPPVIYKNVEEVCLALAFVAAKGMKGEKQGETALAHTDGLDACVIGTTSKEKSEEIIKAVKKMKSNLDAQI
jgi:hypothetical protein